MPPGANPDRDRVELDDAVLISRVLEGDRDAFEPLMRRYLGIVQGYMLNQIRGDHAWEDLVQETFLAAYRQLPRLRRRDRFGPWLLRIARSKLVDHRRGQLRRDVSMRESVVSRSADPAAAGEYAAVVDAIGRLKDRYRTIVYLHLVDEVGPREIAARLAMNESTVRSRLQRGLNMLRETLKRAGIVREDMDK